MDGFDAAWAAYPRKVAKGEARKAWIQTTRIRPPLEQMIEAIENHKQSEQWLDQAGKFIPHFATWLRREQWADEFEIDLGCNKNGKKWYETASGVSAKGQELGIKPESFCLPDGRQDWQSFSAAVKRAALERQAA